MVSTLRKSCAAIYDVTIAYTTRSGGLIRPASPSMHGQFDLPGLGRWHAKSCQSVALKASPLLVQLAHCLSHKPMSVLQACWAASIKRWTFTSVESRWISYQLTLRSSKPGSPTAGSLRISIAQCHTESFPVSGLDDPTSLMLLCICRLLVDYYNGKGFPGKPTLQPHLEFINEFS
jgi:hypothetical protein